MFRFNSVSSNANLVEAGEYTVAVSHCEFKMSKTGNKYLEIIFATNEGKKIWQNYNVFNPNDIARNIALINIKAILKMQGNENSFEKDLSESDLILLLKNGKKFNVMVEIQSDSFGDKNQIKKYLPLNEKLEIKQSEIPF